MNMSRPGDWGGTMTMHSVPQTAPPALMSPPPYEPPPPWIHPEERVNHSDYNNDLRFFLPRTVVLRRVKPSDALGFNIRGGKEHNFGLYVSKVMPNSEAHNLGIREGDQILDVNGINFQTMDHAEAVKILKVNTAVEMVVRYFPYGYQRTYDHNRHNTPMMPSPTSPAYNYR